MNSYLLACLAIYFILVVGIAVICVTAFKVIDLNKQIIKMQKYINDVNIKIGAISHDEDR